jgi:4-diphosphocytidyl-2C-methyl-D-erythritol kinase
VIMVKAPAKINLTLDVIGKRDDGYHEVEMVMTTIDLADRIDVTLTDQPDIVVDCSTAYVPTDERNLAYRAAVLMKETYGIRQGITIRIDKRIPVAAGLGGGSSDAAAVIRALDTLLGLNLSHDEMAALGARIGSDVPFFVYGGTAVARGRGERIEPVSPPPPCWVVLAKPPLAVSTADVYRALRLDAIAQSPTTAAMVDALNRQDFAAVCRSLGNMLETVTFSLHPEVRKLKERMLAFGAEGALMSGSGPTVFALVRQFSRARRITNALRGFCRDVYLVRLLGDARHRP